MALWEHRLERENAECRKTVVIITRLLVQLRFGTARLRVLELRGVEAGVAQPLARGLTGVSLNKANAYQSGRYARVLPLRCSRRCAFNHMNSQKQFRLGGGTKKLRLV